MAAISGYQYLGCYADNSTRLLNGAFFEDLNNMCVENCVKYCNIISTDRFYQFIGVEDGTQCFCGSTFNPPTINADACTMTCSGDSTQKCGANGWINVYSATVMPSGITPHPTSSATTAPLPIITITTTPTSTPSQSPTPSPHISAAVIAVSVIAGVLALALLGILGCWILRRRKRETRPELESIHFQNQDELQYPNHITTHEAGVAELVDTGVPHSQLES